MTERMYSERKGNIPAFRGCRFGCVYCQDTFQRLVQMNKKCPDCAEFEPHFHPEALDRTPPKTKEGEFLTIGLSGDVSFASHDDLVRISSYCAGWSDRTFLIQSKNPAVFLEHYWPENVILGTTIETNREYIWHPRTAPRLVSVHYSDISKAPLPEKRAEAMLKLNSRKSVTIEPILDFDLDQFAPMIWSIKPEIVWIGYDSTNHKLPEPALGKTHVLIDRLLATGIDVREKLLRTAWWWQS